MVPDPVAASKLTTTFALIDVLCVSMRATHISTKELVQLSYDIQKINVEWLLNERELAVVLPYKMDVFGHDNQHDSRKDKPVAIFEVVMRISYLLKDKELPSENEIAHYAGVMGFMHSWPYFRADIQYLTTKLGFPALVLPVVVSGEVPKRVSVSSIQISPQILHVEDARLTVPVSDRKSTSAATKNRRSKASKTTK